MGGGRKGPRTAIWCKPPWVPKLEMHIRTWAALERGTNSENNPHTPTWRGYPLRIRSIEEASGGYP